MWPSDRPSRRDGQPEVYVMPLAGGVATRLTHWGTRSTKLLGWTADGRVVAASPVGQPHATYTWAYALPVDATRTVSVLPPGATAAT